MLKNLLTDGADLVKFSIIPSGSTPKKKSKKILQFKIFYLFVGNEVLLRFFLTADDKAEQFGIVKSGFIFSARF